MPERCAILRIKLADGEVGPKRLARQRHLELGRHRTLDRPRVPLRREAPAKNGLREAAEVGEVFDRAFLGVEGAFHNARAQEPLPLGVTPVEDCSRTDKRRRGYDKTRRPDEADPFAMRKNFGIELGAGHQFVSGQR